MSSGASIGIAVGTPGSQLSLEQENLERKAKENEERVERNYINKFASRYFTPVQFKGTVKVAGNDVDVSRRIYQRHDIDFSYMDSSTGLTNLQRMQKGKPPIGNDGKPIQLHHIIQKEAGPLVEIREVTHEEYHRILHGLVKSGASFRNDPLMNKQYNNFRAAYWKWRATQHTKGE